ncbi:TM2 domain-containing protein [Thermaerobacillus caldiproteolyticus]|uniref:TM2 domain-containing protein n=1 Tax=Thermaerobacillus caldiproteolyticus TaxID=247480 RepID=UPI0018F17847|nr:TM2 domain-containing protein [Anoxybacillus caldiproteolyticus]
MNSILSKHDLTTQELQILSSEMEKRKKSSGTAWLLWIFLGGVGAHRYYLGKTGTAILMTLTLGCLGIWTLIDLFLLSGMIRNTNAEIERQIIEEIRVFRNAQKNDKAL